MSIEKALTLATVAWFALAFAVSGSAAELAVPKAKPGEFDLNSFVREQDKAGPAGAIGHTAIKGNVAKKRAVGARR
jgi:hypothetical protein